MQLPLERQQKLKCSPSIEVTTSEALSVALQHPAVAADQQNVCRLLQVCKLWRQAVQQSAACTTDVEFTVPWPKDGVPDVSSERFTSFTRWLPAHAGIIRSLKLYAPYYSRDFEGSEPQIAEARQLLSRALQTATLQVACPQDGQGSTASPSASNISTPQPLQLQAFEGNTFSACPEILSVLPSSTLTYLWMFAPSKQSFPTSQALQQLTNLRHLTMYNDSRWLSADFVSSIHKLSRLTRLDLEDVQYSTDLQMLPQGLCELELRIDPTEQQPMPLDWSYLSTLQRLNLTLSGTVAAGAALPQQLHELRLNARHVAPSSLGVTQLSQLQRLRIEKSISAAELRYLVQLPALEHLSLSYGHVEVAVEAAAVWPQLPIKELHGGSCCSVETAVAFFQSLPALTQMTFLNFECHICSVEENGAREAVLTLFEPFKQLTQLRKLAMVMSLPDPEMDEDVDEDINITVHPHDLLHLSCLTGLTSLWLECYWDVHGAVPVALLTQLTRLQNLELSFSNGARVLSHAMPVIGTLTSLTRLKISVPDDEEVVCLQYLTRLKNLKELTGFAHCPDVMKQFWAQLRA